MSAYVFKELKVSKEERAAFLEALHAGVELFNRQEFGEAYVRWETRWKEETTEGADLTQGLMLFSFAMLKVQGKEYGTAVRLLESALQKFDGYPDAVYELDLALLRERAQTVLASAKGAAVS